MPVTRVTSENIAAKIQLAKKPLVIFSNPKMPSRSRGDRKYTNDIIAEISDEMGHCIDFAKSVEFHSPYEPQSKNLHRMVPWAILFNKGIELDAIQLTGGLGTWIDLCAGTARPFMLTKKDVKGWLEDWITIIETGLDPMKELPAYWWRVGPDSEELLQQARDHKAKLGDSTKNV